ncbi:MAG: hypothetical protein GTN65_01935 [Armatimonadetes bacterium]|nr:hypothetical protein [Armatimonadota bacterium]NIO95867.1 hypothetical protein [Armatimonadota bacterium]
MSSTSLTRLKIGQDEFRFGEADREVAMYAAAALTEIRGKAEAITGVKGPQTLRILITKKPPRALDFTWCAPSLFVWYGVALAGLLLLIWFPYKYKQSSVSPFDIAGICIAIVSSLVIGLVIVRLLRIGHHTKRLWPDCGGLTMATHSLRAIIALHWPLPQPNRSPNQLAIRTYADASIEAKLAHEYGHCLLRSFPQASCLPAWFDEGFAFWFSEQVTGESFFRPESRACVEEPEDKVDPRLEMTPRDDRYVRLMARYYWEVRTLAEEGRLLDALKANPGALERLRPRLRAGD